MWTAGMEGPGRVKLFGSGTVSFEELSRYTRGKANAEEIVEVLNRGGLNASYSENILFAIYKKACVKWNDEWTLHHLDEVICMSLALQRRLI